MPELEPTPASVNLGPDEPQTGAEAVQLLTTYAERVFWRQKYDDTLPQNTYVTVDPTAREYRALQRTTTGDMVSSAVVLSPETGEPLEIVGSQRSSVQQAVHITAANERLARIAGSDGKTYYRHDGLVFGYGGLVRSFATFWEKGGSTTVTALFDYRLPERDKPRAQRQQGRQDDEDKPRLRNYANSAERALAPPTIIGPVTVHNDPQTISRILLPIARTFPEEYRPKQHNYAERHAPQQPEATPTVPENTSQRRKLGTTIARWWNS